MDNTFFFLLFPFVFFLTNVYFLGRAAGTNARALSKKVIISQQISKLCESVISPTVLMALRLRAVLLQGIVVIHHKQTVFLLKECTSVWKGLQESTKVQPRNTNINLEGTGKASNTSISLAVATHNAVDVAEDPFGDESHEQGRGDEMEIALEASPAVLDLNIRREEITLQPERMSMVMPEGEQGEMLAAFGEDFHFDAMDLEQPLAGFEEQPLFLDEEMPLAGTPHNPLLDRLDLEAPPSGGKGVKRHRSIVIEKDSSTRLPGTVLRKWLADDRHQTVQRPTRMAPSRVKTVASDDQLISMDINAELQCFLTDHIRSHADYQQSFLESSVEQMRGAKDDSVDFMDLEWDEHEQRPSEGGRPSTVPARASDPRLPSISPSGPLQFISEDEEHSSQYYASPRATAVEDQYRLSVHDQSVADDQTDLRTYKLKMLMRSKFDEDDLLSFNHFTSAVKTRKAMANTFYHILLLSTTSQLEPIQDVPYGDIVLKKANFF